MMPVLTPPLLGVVGTFRKTQQDLASHRAASETPAVFADSLDAGPGRSKLRLNLTAPPATTGGAADLVVEPLGLLQGVWSLP
jgi:hypothetical protein